MKPQHSLIPYPHIKSTQVLTTVQSGQLLQLSAEKGNVLIICYAHHAEIVGSGSAVGGCFDASARQIIPVGDVSFSVPQSTAEKQQAYKIRKMWMNTVQNVNDKYTSSWRRVWILLSMMANYCGWEKIEPLSDQLIAHIVNVLPATVAKVRPVLRRKYTECLNIQMGETEEGEDSIVEIEFVLN